MAAGLVRNRHPCPVWSTAASLLLLFIAAMHIPKSLVGKRLRIVPLKAGLALRRLRGGWKEGDRIFCQYSHDGRWYDAKVDEVLEQDSRYLVTFLGYNEQEEREEKHIKKQMGQLPPVGSTFDGEVVGIKGFGIFVRFNYEGQDRDGLVHISDMCEGDLIYPGDLVKRGDNVKVRVASYKNNEKIGLSMIGLNPDKKPVLLRSKPSRTASRDDIGYEVTGRVVTTKDFGLFIRTAEFNRDILVPRRLIDGEPDADASLMSRMGERAKVRIIGVDTDRGDRVSATMVGPGLGFLDRRNQGGYEDNDDPNAFHEN
mmetsp:Transcript_12538/g.19937  ORF Transcript_12538/g.19937 Transcript_12538/m.19937 type:complete len:313 (-) Transcript_12538:186-1124(-)